MEYKGKLGAGLALLCLLQSAWAIDSISFSAGSGKPNHLRGARLAVQKDWHKVWGRNQPSQLRGYWDFSAAFWHTDGDCQGKHQDIGILAVAPVFRLQHAWFDYLTGYLEASVGLATLNTDHIGYRDLGGELTFQDLLGGGFILGTSKQWEIAYHYLHYSNAGLLPPNKGIDVKVFVTLSYRFMPVDYAS